MGELFLRVARPACLRLCCSTESSAAPLTFDVPPLLLDILLRRVSVPGLPYHGFDRSLLEKVRSRLAVPFLLLPPPPQKKHTHPIHDLVARTPPPPPPPVLPATVTDSVCWLAVVPAPVQLLCTPFSSLRRSDNKLTAAIATQVHMPCRCYYPIRPSALLSRLHDPSQQVISHASAALALPSGVPLCPLCAPRPARCCWPRCYPLLVSPTCGLPS